MSENTQAFYEENAEIYFNQTVNADLSHLYGPFLERLPSGGAILDAGCGSGRDLLIFSQKGFKVLGIDASTKLVQMAKSYSNCQVEVMDFTDIEFQEKFNGIWACASLLHIDKSKLPSILSNFTKALIPGGILFASVREGVGTRTGNDGRTYTFYNENEFKNKISDSGLKLEHTWVTNDVLENREKLTWINVLAKKLKQI